VRGTLDTESWRNLLAAARYRETSPPGAKLPSRALQQ
jgi:hypothetical protein